MAEETREKTNFIWEAIKADIAEGKNGGRVQTRFPPEPNGYLHIGHVKALSVDFLTAERFGDSPVVSMSATTTFIPEKYSEKIGESYILPSMYSSIVRTMLTSRRIFLLQPISRRLFFLQLTSRRPPFVDRSSPAIFGLESPARNLSPAISGLESPDRNLSPAIFL